MSNLQLEKQRLSDTISTLKNVIESERDNLRSISSLEMDDLLKWELVYRKEVHIKNLNESLDKPYFARIDFKGSDKLNQVYIGKYGILDGDEIVVTDWRAPIASVYYDGEIGACSYLAPEGLIKGTLELKRQYDIEKGELLEYFDVDLVSNDALLQKYLQQNNDNRLKQIVSTIQKEQNEVIRKDINKNIFIQGVAGSGKTTVALHRIAYLVYNYIDSIKLSDYLVIGPNPVFLKYIDGVLPDLDVVGVRQLTFEEFTKEYINEDICINSSDLKTNKYINGTLNKTIDKFKSSLKYKDMIDRFMDYFEDSITDDNLMLGDFLVLNSKKIKEVYKMSNGSSISNRVELTIERITKYIKMHLDEYLIKYNNYSYELFNSVTDKEVLDKLRRESLKGSIELKKYCRSTIRKYFNKVKLDISKIYKLFIDNIDEYNIYDYEYINELKDYTKNSVNKKIFDYEDLAALLYIKYYVSPNKDIESIRHTVVDEAQDLGEFNFYCLKCILPASTFSIFGDLAQSIYDYRGIDNWDQVNNVMFNGSGEIINFNKSYRTTREIMSVADKVAVHLGLGRSDMVVRSGSPVEFSSTENIPKHIFNKINEYVDNGYKTIAVISKTEDASKNINDKLANLGMFIPNVSSDDDLTQDKFRICTISNALAKGLEFDAVIINNASENIYSSNNTLDMKLLYVAITRALHELDIVYDGNLCEVLKEK